MLRNTAAIVLLLGSSVALAKLPELRTIPPTLPAARAAALGPRRAKLEERLGALRRHADQHNTRCAAVDEGSKALEDCRTDNAAFVTERDAWVVDAEAFNRDLDTALCSTYDQAARRTAAATAQAQRDLLARLDAQVEKLKQWSDQAGRDAQEFERMRAVDASQELADALGAIPMQVILERLAQVPRLAARLSEARRARIMAGYHTTRGLLAGAETLTAESPTKQGREGLATVHHLVGTMTELLGTQLIENEQGRAARQVLGGLDRAFGVAAALIGYLTGEPSPKTGTRVERWRAEGKAIVEIGAIFEWPIATALGIEEVAYAEARRKLGTRAVEQLASAANDEWNAKAYLEAKIARIKTELVELERVEKCK
jgi:hypothetical protein